MAGDKFLYYANGRAKEKAAIQSSAGAGDAGKIPALDASGRIDTTMMPVGIGADTKTITASEALAAGAVVNVWQSTGAKVRNADATAEGKEAIGFVLSSVSNGASATVYFEGTITGLSGLTEGARYYLSASTPGAVTATPPGSAGNVVQYIGTAISTTELSFEPDIIATLA